LKVTPGTVPIIMPLKKASSSTFFCCWEFHLEFVLYHCLGKPPPC
jgi:hypothetical protein